MGIVQENVGDSGTDTPATIDATLPAATTAGAGRWVILVVASDATVNTPAGFSLDRSQVNNAGHYHFRKAAANGETSWTVTPTSAAATAWYVAEVNELDASAPLDQVTSLGTGASGTTQSTGTTGTTTQADELVFASFSLSVSGETTLTVDSYTNSFVERGDTHTDKAAGTDICLAVAAKQVAATGTQECTATYNVPGARTGIIVTYKLAEATPPSAAPAPLVAPSAAVARAATW